MSMMDSGNGTAQPVEIERQQMDVDVVCVGFGPASGGFLTTLARELVNDDGSPKIESRVMPGMPLQVICYERADDIGFGVSGVVTKARGIRATFPDLNPEEIPMAANVGEEKVVYLLDPVGASRRPLSLRAADKLIRAGQSLLRCQHDAVELPYTPDFLHKKGGLLLSIGQFNQWVGQQLMLSGLVQVWPGTPVAQPLVEDGTVVGVRLADQGVDRNANPEPGFLPGMDIRAALTVVGDGPIGPVGRKLDEIFGVPPKFEQQVWAVGAKMVIDLPEGVDLEPGTVLHTLGYPEPEIFGFFYVHPGRIASVGIFVPSWFETPVRTTYRYLQHFLQHPYIWRYLRGGTLRSWGAKTLQESGKRGEPHLAGNGYARIGEGSGSTNVLTGSGVDEAWTTGVQLAEGLLELLKQDLPFTRENLEAAYVARRRASWVESEAKVAQKARDGFHFGFLPGLMGMALAGVSDGMMNLWDASGARSRIPTLEEYYDGIIPPEEIARIVRECREKGLPLHNALMERAGWPPIKYDGQLLVSHQDALLLGGKVQAPPGYADHVTFLYPSLCENCDTQICVEICSGQAITPGEGNLPAFDREKCIHCGACIWNCAHPQDGKQERGAIDFRAGAGGLHSAEN
jgi:electron-transferring-flavoprotein dehydrogenase